MDLLRVPLIVISAIYLPVQQHADFNLSFSGMAFQLEAAASRSSRGLLIDTLYAFLRRNSS